MSAITAKEINGKAMSREPLLEFIETSTKTIDLEYPVDIKITKHTGLLNCYAVFWLWMRHITKHLKETYPGKYINLTDNGESDPEDKKACLHDIVCMMFLGETKPKKIGKTIIPPTMKTLTKPKMNTGQVIDLLRRIEEWCISEGIILPQPKSEYTEAR